MAVAWSILLYFVWWAASHKLKQSGRILVTKFWSIWDKSWDQIVMVTQILSKNKKKYKRENFVCGPYS